MSDSISDCKVCQAIPNVATSPSFVYADDLWVLRHSGKPYPALGWMTMHSRRHCTALTELNDLETASLGPTLRRVAQVIKNNTGALRIYIASLTEATPHFHVHLVPRYEGGPTQWATFNDLSRAREGLVQVDEDKVLQVIKACREALASGR